MLGRHVTEEPPPGWELSVQLVPPSVVVPIPRGPTAIQSDKVAHESDVSKTVLGELSAVQVIPPLAVINTAVERKLSVPSARGGPPRATQYCVEGHEIAVIDETANVDGAPGLPGTVGTFWVVQVWPSDVAKMTGVKKLDRPTAQHVVGPGHEIELI